MQHELTIAAARLRVREGARWLWPILAKANFIADASVETACVSTGAVIRYNPTWVESLDARECSGLLVHEVLHLALQSAQRLGTRDPMLWNIASDIVINEMIREMGIALPREGTFAEQYGIPRGLTADEVYDRLQQGGAKRKDGGGSKDPQCGSGAGNKHPSEPSDVDGAGDDGAGSDDGADEAAGKSPGEVGRAVRASLQEAAEEVKQGGKRAGKVPQGLQRLLGDLLRAPTIPWERTLATLVRRAVQWRPGASHQRYDAPSKIQSGVGYGPGKPVLPRWRQAVPHVAVAIDTSGSMDGDTLDAAMHEVRGVLRAVGAKVTFVVCDAKVHGVRDVSSVQQAKQMLRGGGGTDFRPVFDALKTRRPDVLVFLTDGHGDAPSCAPPFAVVWALMGYAPRKPVSWGADVRIDRGAQ